MVKNMNRSDGIKKNHEAPTGIRELVWMRNNIFILLTFLIAQFWLGMTINLEVNMPVKHLGAISSILYFGSSSGFILAHMVNGFMILAASILFVIVSMKSPYVSLRIGAIVTLASVIGAVVNGVLFLDSGQDFGWSVGMAMSAVGVFVSAAVSLYFVGKNSGFLESVKN